MTFKKGKEEVSLLTRDGCLRVFFIFNPNPFIDYEGPVHLATHPAWHDFFLLSNLDIVPYFASKSEKGSILNAYKHGS